MTALALLSVTAVLVVLLAVVFHLGVAAAVVGIVGILATMPGAYLAWAALPSDKSAYGRPAGRWDPVELGVHPVIGGGAMPAYVRRAHGELLRAVLDPAVPASRLVVVRGGSSTGKTRAAYEAVADRLAGWQLDYPRDPAALKERLEAGIPAHTVLWLGELRQYADAEGGAEVLGRLADLIVGEGRLLITTVWPEQWTAYAAAARPGPKTGPVDPAGTAGRLLEPLPKLTGRDPAGIDPARGGVIDVPPRFTAADLEAAAGTGDLVLAKTAAAAASAGQDGQVTQYLAGVPDLLDRYEGSGGDPYGQAVITAAMDATRLGHASLLPAALVQEAAVGYLTGPQRTTDIASWRDTALAWAAEELKGAVRALQPIPPPSGTGVAGYQVADYLDQHSRRTRQDQLGPASLWDALTTHAASGRDLTRLGKAARDRGLYRHAAALWTTAASLGSADAASELITHLQQVSPADTTRAAHWAAGQVSLDDPRDVAVLLVALHLSGPATRSPPCSPATPPARSASTTRGPSPRCWGCCARPGRQRGRRPGRPGGQPGQPRRPAGRRCAAGDAARGRGRQRGRRPGRPGGRPGQPRRPGGRRRAAAGAARGRGRRRGRRPARPRPRRPGQPRRRPLGGRAAAAGAARGRAGDAAAALAARVAGQVSLDDPEAVAALLRALHEAGAGDAVAALLARDPAGQVSLDDPEAVAALLRALHEAGAGDAVAALRRPSPCWCGRCTRPGATKRSPPCSPATPPARSASTTRRTSPGCYRSCARPGPATRSPPGSPTRVCSIVSLRFVLTRPPATDSGASLTEPRRNPGDGKSRPGNPDRGPDQVSPKGATG